MWEDGEYKNPLCEHKNCISREDHLDLIMSFYKLQLKCQYHDDKKILKFGKKFFEKYRIAICDEDEAEMWCTVSYHFGTIDLAFHYNKPRYFKDNFNVKNYSNVPWFAIAIEKNTDTNFLFNFLDRINIPIPVRLLYKDNES